MSATPTPENSSDAVSLAQAIHREAIVFDALAFPYICEDPYLERARLGGVTTSIVTAAYDDTFESAVRKIDDIHNQIARRPSDLMLALRGEDIRHAKATGRIAIILGFQDTKPFGADLAFLRSFYRLGVRCIQLTYNSRNLLGDGCCERTDCGLSFAGREVIEEMNRLGILLDLSHCGDRTTVEALEQSNAPSAFTHSNARAMCTSVRNKSDEQLVALASRGGVVGLSSHPAFVGGPGASPTLEDFLDHLNHIVALVGVEHVGIGLDLVEKMKETGTVLPASVYWRTRRPDVFGTVRDAVDKPYAHGIDSISKMANVTIGLVKRGYQKDDILKIMGANFLRLFESVCG